MACNCVIRRRCATSALTLLPREARPGRFRGKGLRAPGARTAWASAGRAVRPIEFSEITARRPKLRAPCADADGDCSTEGSFRGRKVSGIALQRDPPRREVLSVERRLALRRGSRWHGRRACAGQGRRKGDLDEPVGAGCSARAGSQRRGASSPPAVPAANPANNRQIVLCASSASSPIWAHRHASRTGPHALPSCACQHGRGFQRRRKPRARCRPVTT